MTEPQVGAGDICGEPTITVGDLWCYLIDRMLAFFCE